MYGTIAKMKVKPGHIDALLAINEEVDEERGMAFVHCYKIEGAENDYVLAVGFESKAAYEANAKSPEQHQRYLQYLEHLESEPEWQDGEIIWSRS